MAEVQVRPAAGADLAEVARVISTVCPDNPVSLEEMAWSDRTYPGGARFLGLLDGAVVGAAGVGRVHAYGPEYGGLWANIAVLPEARRHGVGGSLYAAVSEHTRAAGKSFLIGRTSEDEPAALEFLRRRGFEEHERMKVVRLELRGLEPPPVDPPPGVEIASLEERPDLAAGIFEVANEALPDIPGEGPERTGTLEEFLARDVDKPLIPRWGFAVAVDSASGQAVGYASLHLVSGSPGLAWHHMTGVARAWRGRGVASALKRATIGWAIEHGLEALEGANDVANTPMREINRRLGYLPRPDEIIMRGPLAPADAEPLPPDPEAYDSPRAVQARRKGLRQPYIAGGRDPDPERTRREERRLLWLLIAMIVAIVLAGYVLGFLSLLAGG